MARGRKTGGRQKGTPNRKTIERLAELHGMQGEQLVFARRLEQTKLAGQSPLEYMLSVMRDPTAKQCRRDEMAKCAAPYMHPRLSALDVGRKEGSKPVTETTNVTVVNVDVDLQKLSYDELTKRYAERLEAQRLIVDSSRKESTIDNVVPLVREGGD